MLLPIFELAGQKIKQGKPVIIDASFKKREERQRALRLAQTLGVPFYILECFCPDEITRQAIIAKIKGDQWRE